MTRPPEINDKTYTRMQLASTHYDISTDELLELTIKAAFDENGKIKSVASDELDEELNRGSVI